MDAICRTCSEQVYADMFLKQVKLRTPKLLKKSRLSKCAACQYLCQVCWGFFASSKDKTFP